VKVWRVAHESARYEGFPAGPYACSEVLPKEVNAAVWVMGMDHADESHPSPYADRKLRGIRAFERCGFSSREALCDWFADWFAVLDEAGFRAYEYDVPDWDVRVGGQRGQVCFRPDEARELSCEPFALKPEQMTLFA
jgi:hypothetical protein